MNPFALGSRYYFSRLSDYEKSVYRKIYDCWVTGGNVAQITLPGSGFLLPSGRELHSLVSYIIDENPHLFHLETSHFQYSRRDDQVTIRADKVYSDDEYAEVYTKLRAQVGQIRNAAGQYPTDYEKFRFLHDYLAETITYDRGAPDAKSQREVHTIVGALLNRACVCDGYARAYRLLCDQLHLSSVVAIGNSTAMDNAGPHAWNFVKLNKKVYHVDVTWDSCLIAGGCPISDYYFMRNDAIFSKDHSWDSAIYPQIMEDYPRTEPSIANKRELEKYICEKVAAGEKRICVRFKDNFPGNEALQRAVKGIIKRHPLLFISVRSYKSSYYDSIKYAEIFID